MIDNDERRKLVDFICERFSDEEIVDLYTLHFPDSQRYISRGDRFRSKVLALVDYCGRRGYIPKLRGILAEERPGPYKDWFADDQPSDLQVTNSVIDQSEPLQHSQSSSLVALPTQAWSEYDSIEDQDLWLSPYDDTKDEYGDSTSIDQPHLRELIKGYSEYLKRVAAQYMPADYQSLTYWLVGLVAALVLVVVTGIILLTGEPEQQSETATARFVLQPGDTVSVPVGYRQTAVVATTDTLPQTLSITVQDCSLGYCELLLVSNLTQRSPSVGELTCIIVEPFVVAVANGDRDNYRVLVTELAEGFNGNTCLYWSTPSP